MVLSYLGCLPFELSSTMSRIWRNDCDVISLWDRISGFVRSSCQSFGYYSLWDRISVKLHLTGKSRLTNQLKLNSSLFILMPKLFYYSTLAEGMRILCGGQGSTHLFFFFAPLGWHWSHLWWISNKLYPKEESRNIYSFGLICIYQTIFNNLHGTLKVVTTLF